MTQFPCQKNFLEKNGSKLVQRSPRRCLKNKQLKMVFRTNWKSLKYAPKEFSKDNVCARDPP